MKPDRMTGKGNGCHDSASNRFCRFRQRMVNSRLSLCLSAYVNMKRFKSTAERSPAAQGWPRHKETGRRKSSVNGKSAERSSRGMSKKPGVWPWS